MPSEPFMLVSLKEDKAKKLAQVMSNPTCTRILEYLAGKDATESQIAKDLKIPLSTVHYNLQQLREAKLVIVDEFHYSEKGREVNHYKLANKYIIIAPQEDSSFVAHLKKYLPVVVIVAGFSVAIKLLQFTTGTTEQVAEPALMMAKTAPEAGSEIARETADATVNAGAEAAFAAMTGPAPEPVAQALPWWQSPLVDYFIAGALFVLLLIILIEAINYWRLRRR
jgi:DNA-binding transcriptional ArsR family regulator